MAYLEKRNEIYRIVFRLNGTRFSRSLETDSETAANLALAKVKDGLHRIKTGLLELAPEDDVVNVLLSTGAVRQKPILKNRTLSVGRLLDDYVAAIPDGSIEEESLGMLSTHVNNLKRHLGPRLSTSQLNLAKLQAFVNARSKEQGIHGGKVSPVTIRKEITTLHAAWTWALESEIIAVPLPKKARLKYPKRRQKPPFMTWDEIERVIRLHDVGEAQERVYWDCLFLDERQVKELISDVGSGSAPECIRTMIAVAGYTGARRSELMRSQVEDFDMVGRKFTIREKKRVRSQHSTRSVPISNALHDVLIDWFNVHPGGRFAFSLDGTAIRRNQAHNYFVRALKPTKWHVLRGWHCLRHSFISNCAAKNIDQRIIDDWVGHQTEAMRQRYRHLFPNIQQQAIELVFGDALH